ncbi:MAG: hypothetical protein A3D41_01135 [Candidatus Sungbacteria bacterium RIFCSPHIGHO2_02_FULL_41_12b]|nr:MAG: hypothetical protein A3D41_01135 [Candidatus Sungbacteria bacterium RIFCSPHIGHO2_02_FULL_41_12b]
MDKKRVFDRIEKLKKEINYHRYLYHVLDKQEISDAALDSLKNELMKLEKQFPEFLTPDSPTQRVGGNPLEKFRKVAHTVRMTSLNDAFSEEELHEWETRIKKLVSDFKFHVSELDYFAEAKGDGFAVSLIYKNGVFKTGSIRLGVRQHANYDNNSLKQNGFRLMPLESSNILFKLLTGSTRGDGITGEDVTENLKTVESIPLSIQKNIVELSKKHKEIKIILEKYPRVKQFLSSIHKITEIEVRGEVYMPKDAFNAANKEQKKKGLPVFANPRNIAAGSIRQLNPKITASRNLEFFAWDLVTNLGQETHEEEHLIMRILGFPTVPLTKHCKNTNEIIEFWKEVGRKREKLPFLIDGVVIQINNGKIFEKLGIVGKAPRGAIAFKFPAEETTTIVKNIIVQVGRTGVLTPVATLKPVRIGGVTVTHATLHNIDEIRRLDVRIGDTVIVERAGDVIPAVTGVLRRLRPKNAKEFHMPLHCPVCNSPVKKIESADKKQEFSVAYYCSNKNCGAVEREKLYHFISKKAFDIQGLGPKIIDALIESGLIKNAADIFTLKKEELEPLERFAEKSASKLIASINQKRTIELNRFIYSLGIHHVGEETAIDLAKNFGSINALNLASPEKLEKIRDIGGVVAKSIYNWFRDKKNRELLNRFKKAGLKIKIESQKPKKHKFKDKTFVLTGELESFTRDEAKGKIRNLGGEISESVNKKTDYVVAGENPGLKYNKAMKFGVKILSEEEFLNIIK